jgi:hypothetical protein
MTTRAAFALALVCLAPAAVGAQGVEIDHKQVGCIVVGKFPKMGACFTPAAQLARGRVYFRPEGTPSWYYVEMKSDAPCFTGILPKPGKKLVGTKVEYYVEAQDRTFNAARTAEFAPIVVESAGECEKDIPVAPFVNNATVAVFPSVPAGFVGSAAAIGTTAIVGVAAAGAAVAGTAVAVAASNDDTTTTTVAVGGNTTTTIAATTTTTTTSTTTTLASTNRPPDARLTTIPDPPVGVGPLTVTFDMCASTDPDGDPLSFFFEFGDGTQASGACSQTHTYAANFRATSGASAATRTYTFEGNVVDPSGASRGRSREVTSRDPETPTCPKPTISLSDVEPDICNDLDLEATTTNATKVTFCVEPTSDFDCFGYGFAATSTLPQCEEGTGSGGTFTASFNVEGSGCFKVTAVAENDCGNSASAPPQFTFDDCGGGYFAPRGDGTTAWSSDLAVEGGRLQVVMNGAGASFPGRGRAYGMGAIKEGENRIEATLVEAGGKPGLWRFDFMGSQAVTPGSIRVIAGEAVEIGSTAITFRLKGTPGERIAFTFRRN